MCYVYMPYKSYLGGRVVLVFETITLLFDLQVSFYCQMALAINSILFYIVCD